MPTILNSKSIYYNDCVLVSQNPGKVKSRNDIPNELYRIICAPMTSIIGYKFIEEAAKNGISVCIPRFLDRSDKILMYNIFNNCKINDKQLCFMGVGLNEMSSDLISLSDSAQCKSWLIDIAFAGIPQLNDSIINLQKYVTLDNLMIGNIMSGAEFERLYLKYHKICNKLFCRVGVAGGSACQTSDVSSYGRGQITEQIECYNIKRKYKNPPIQIGDGGIKHSGYALKSFGCGSDYAMMGRYFVNALESETNVKGEGEYWGLASERQIKLSGLNKSHSEGKIHKLNKNDLKPLKQLITELWGGISSGISYSGYTSLTDFIGNAIIEIKQNSLPPRNRI